MQDVVQLDSRHGQAAEKRARRYGLSVEAYVALLIDRDLGHDDDGFDAFRQAAAPIADALGGLEDDELQDLVDEAREASHRQREQG